MENLEIKGQLSTYFTPNISFNASTSICEISGESYLEDSFEFYDRLIKWVDDFFSEGAKTITVNFRLTYFNTSSSRAILDFLRNLKKHEEKGKTVTVNWYYPDPDYDEMQMEAEDYMDEVGIHINLISYKVG